MAQGVLSGSRSPQPIKLTRGTKAKGDQIVSDRPIVRLVLSQSLFRHSDKEAALVTLHQEGHGVLVVSLGDSVAYFLY